MKREISNIILGVAGTEDGFTLKYGFLTFHLKIKPLTVKQLIAISTELSQVRDIKQDTDMFPALMASVPDANHICKSIAIATGTRYQRIVTRAIGKLSLKDIQTLFTIVIKQSDPAPFFLTCLQIGKINILTTTKEQQ